MTAKLAHPFIQRSHLFTGEGGERLAGLQGLEAQRCLICISPFSCPSNDFVEISSWLKGAILEEPGLADMAELLGRRSGLLLRPTLTCRPDVGLVVALASSAAAFTGLRLSVGVCRFVSAAAPASAPFISVAGLLEVRANNKLELWQQRVLAHLPSPCIGLRLSSPMMRAVRGFLTS